MQLTTQRLSPMRRLGIAAAISAAVLGSGSPSAAQQLNVSASPSPGLNWPIRTVEAFPPNPMAAARTALAQRLADDDTVLDGFIIGASIGAVAAYGFGLSVGTSQGAALNIAVLGAGLGGVLGLAVDAAD